MAHLGKSEKVLASFIDMYDANITLKKVIWRLDHPLAHTVARLVTRNNSIHRRKSQNKPFDDLLPDCMKNRSSTLGRGAEMVAAAAAAEAPAPETLAAEAPAAAEALAAAEAPAAAEGPAATETPAAL